MPDSKIEVLVRRSLFRCQSIGIDVPRQFSLPLAENQGVDSSNLSLGTTKTRSRGGFFCRFGSHIPPPIGQTRHSRVYSSRQSRMDARSYVEMVCSTDIRNPQSTLRTAINNNRAIASLRGPPTRSPTSPPPPSQPVGERRGWRAGSGSGVVPTQSDFNSTEWIT